jgi:dynein heavy chain 2
LFGRLNAVKDRWLQWVALGSVDLDRLADKYLHTSEDWDLNFRASKTWSQEIAKLPA